MTEAVASDEKLRQVLSICRSLGVSVRRYLGWEPRRWTRTLPSGEQVTETEPEYDTWERMLWAAYSEWEAGHCPGCRQPLDECLVDESIPESERPIYDAGKVTCAACAAIARSQTLQIIADQEWAEKNQREAKRNPRTPQANQWLAIRRR